MPHNVKNEDDSDSAGEREGPDSELPPPPSGPLAHFHRVHGDAALVGEPWFGKVFAGPARPLLKRRARGPWRRNRRIGGDEGKRLDFDAPHSHSIYWVKQTNKEA